MRRATNLETMLDAYEASSALSDGAAVKARQRTWPVYAAAAGSGLAMATAAGAGIIYSGPENKSISLHLTSSSGFGLSFFARQNLALDIDGKGHSFNLHLSRQDLGFINLNNGLAGLGGLGPNRSVLANGSGNLKFLASGAKISSGAGIFKGNGGQYGGLNLKSRSNGTFGNHGTHGTWPAGVKGFAAIKFTQATGSNPGTHLGWIQLEWTANSNGFPNTLEAFDWAYNTVAGQSILAGEIPEPSTLVMALLASGSVGVLAWRRRKRQGAAGTDAGTDAGASGAALN